jgi:uncharacterized protein YbcI
MTASSQTARDPMLMIYNGMVSVFKEVLGRGPRRGRASFTGADSLVVVLEQTLTTAERNLLELGEHRRLHELRLAIQAALEPRARAVVEEVLRRQTRAFAAGIDPLHDVAAVFFTLGDRIEPHEPSRRPRPPGAADVRATAG